MSEKTATKSIPADHTTPCQGDSSVFRCWGTTRLRFLILVPLATVTTIIILTLSLLHFLQQRETLHHDVVQMYTSANDFYEERIRYDAQVLKTIMHSLGHDTVLHDALARRDRTALLQRAKPFFTELRDDFNITHLYFTTPDRINLLRVHTPARYGDVIDRITTLKAEQSGEIAYGVELGPLGTFTLRLVSPWYDTQSHTLIGYVELGMEIDQVLNKLEEFFGLQVITTVYKEFLQREKWEVGMRALGRTPHWDRLVNMVASEHSTDKIPPLMVKHLKHGKKLIASKSMELTKSGLTYQMIHLPLYDAGKREVGQMILLANVTQHTNKVKKTLYISSAAMFLAGTILFIFFYWLTGKVGRYIEHDEKALQNLAVHDGLTGLYNHKTFYSLLEDEIKRSLRHARPLVLLMLDIDYFKQVNDTYGHQAGDMILRELSRLLMRQARETDRVCRYGGEEMTLILPEINTVTALEVAERFRKAVEAHIFTTSDGQQLSITISLGIAAYPKDADTKETLVAVADAAMYQAKQSGRNQVCVHAPPS